MITRLRIVSILGVWLLVSWCTAFVHRPGILHSRPLVRTSPMHSIAELKSPRKKQRYVDELSKLELFTRIQSQRRRSHDDVVVGSSIGEGEYTIPQAERYRSSDWGKILMATPGSIVLHRIIHPLVYHAIWAFAVAEVNRRFGVPRQIGGQIHGLLGSALGLLLVFRTNASYQRFWFV